MARHHNNAILAAITEQGLDPTKAYVAGKNGLVLSTNELKKIRSLATTSKPVQVLPQVKEVKEVENQKVIPPEEEELAKVVIETIEKQQTVEESQDSAQVKALEETLPIEDTKFKKKTKKKIDQTIDQS